MIVIKDVKGIPQELFRPGSEGVEVPFLPQDLREFCYLQNRILARASIDEVQPNRVLRVAWLHHDESFAQIIRRSCLLTGDDVRQDRRGVAMQVEVNPAASGA